MASQIGLAFFCGVVVTIGVLTTTSVDTKTMQYKSPTALRSSSVMITPLVQQTVLKASSTVEVDDGIVNTPWTSTTRSIDSAPPSAAYFNLWGLGLVFVAMATIIAQLMRRLSHATGLPALETVVWLPDISMAAYQGKKQEKDTLMSVWANRRKWLGAPLSKELRAVHNVRTMMVQKGDEVEVQSGSFKGTVGKVLQADTRDLMIYVEGVEKKGSNGKAIPVPLYPSVVKITKLSLEDAHRLEILERRAKGRAEEAARRAVRKSEGAASNQ